MILCGVISFGNAYSQQYHFKAIDLIDGLPQNKVKSVFQDSTGVIWLGTEEGLARYNGVEAEVFSKENDNLNAYTINDVDQYNGSVHIATNVGLFYLSKGKFLQDDFPGVAIVKLNTLHYHQGKNALIIGTTNGLFVKDEGGIRKLDYSQLNGKSIIELYVDRRNKIWIATENEGLYQLSDINLDSKGELKDFYQSGFKVKRIRGIGEDKNGLIWLGTLGYGLYTYDMGHFNSVSTPVYFKGNYVSKIYTTPKNDLWFATWGEGLVHYNGFIFKKYHLENGLPDNIVLDVKEDYEGNVLVGTLSAGLQIFQGEMFMSMDMNDGLPDNHVRDIQVDKEGNYWFSTYKGLVKHDVTDVKVYKQENAENRFGPIQILNTDTIYVGSYTGGVYQYSENKFQKLTISPLIDRAEILSLKLSGNKLIVGSFGRGLAVYDIKQNVLDSLYSVDEKSIWEIFRDRSGVIWLGTNQGVYTLKDSLKQFYPSNYNISESKVNQIIEGKNGELLLATEKSGIWRFNKSNASFHYLKKENNLSSNNIKSLAWLNKDVLIAGTLNGINYIDFSDDTTRISYFNSYNDQFKNDFSENAILLDDEGKVWFGTNDGVLIFQGNTEQLSVIIPKVIIESFQLFYGKEDPSEYVKEYIGNSSVPQEIELPYDQNHLTIGFTGVGIKHGGNINYQYKLEGVDKEWSPLMKDRSVTFPNLSEGKYTFVVRATADGKNFSEEKRIEIIITPPFYRTIWFYSLCVIVFLGIGVGYFIYSYYKKKSLEKLIDQRTKELAESEAKYRYIIKSAADGIYQSDINGELTLVNDQLEEILGYNEKELIGKRIIDFCVPSFKRDLDENLASMINSNREGYFEYQVQTKTGKVKWIGQKTRRVDDEFGGMGIQAVIRDISDKKNAEIKLLRYNDRLRILNSIETALLESENLIDLIKKTVTSLRDMLHVERVSIAMFDEYTQTFVSYSATLNNHSSIIQGRPYPLSGFDAYNEIKNGKAVLVEDLGSKETISDSDIELLKENIFGYYLFPLSHGRTVFGSLNVSTSQKAFFSNDIIQTIKDVAAAVSVAIHQAELNGKIKENEERLRELFEGTSDLIQSVDDRGRFIFVNESWRKTLGYSEKEIEELKLENILHETNREECLKLFNKAILGNENLSNLEVKFLTKKGETIHALGNTVTKKGKDGRVVSRSIFHDVTERIKAEEIIHQKNKDITDSINYAKRIQDGILPNEKFFTNLLPNSFIFYQPKDIVSGDFFWIDRAMGKVVFAVADCTGHGVPGGFMSILGANFFNQAVNERGMTNPAMILNFTSFGIVNTFAEEVEGEFSEEDLINDDIMDGMDVCMCVFDPENMMLEYAGANIPLYIVREGELITLAPDKHPVGRGYTGVSNKFISKEIELHEGDMLYMLSDGYPDQFGGPNTKKFNRSRLLTQLVEAADKSTTEQKQLFEQVHVSWKGDNVQTDDVTLIGIPVGK